LIYSGDVVGIIAKVNGFLENHRVMGIYSYQRVIKSYPII